MGSPKNQLRTSPPNSANIKNHTRHKSTAPSPRKYISKLSRGISAFISLSHFSRASTRNYLHQCLIRETCRHLFRNRYSRCLGPSHLVTISFFFPLLLDPIRISSSFLLLLTMGQKFSIRCKNTWLHCKVLPRSSLGAAAKSMYGRATEFCVLHSGPRSGRHSGFFSGSLYCV